MSWWLSLIGCPPAKKALLLWGTACLLVVMAGWLTPAQAGWEVREYQDRDYVTLKSFCEFYGFPFKEPGEKDEFFKASNGRHDVVFRMNSRIVFIDGVRHWMSFGCFKDGEKGPWIISKLDVIKLFEPILRPHMIKDRSPIRGIVLDAGHGGSDNGAGTSRVRQEKIYTLDMVRRVDQLLQAAGIKTALTRRSDVFVELDERARIASRYSGYVFVSIHFNYARTNARGLEVYACTPEGSASTNSEGRLSRSDFQRQVNNTHDSRNVLLAYEIQKQLVKLWPGDEEADRGVKRARFVVLRKNYLPSVLVEGGFLSNASEARRIDDASYRQKLAVAIATGIRNFIGQMELPMQRVTPPPVRAPAISTEAPPVPAPKPPAGDTKPAPAKPGSKPEAKPAPKPESKPSEEAKPKPKPEEKPAPEAPKEAKPPGQPAEEEPRTIIYGS